MFQINSVLMQNAYRTMLLVVCVPPGHRCAPLCRGVWYMHGSGGQT